MKVNNNNWIISLFLPVTNFITILFNPNRKNFKIIFILFFIFLGLGTIIDFNGYNDISRYVIKFIEASSLESISLK